MERADFVSHFAKRLNTMLLERGYASTRARTGTEVNKLAKIAGVSYQMARKYSLGMALPEYHVIPKIAKWLDISPSWLLFGEKDPIVPPDKKPSSSIEIESDLLKYILQKCMILFPPVSDIDKIINYIVGIIYDASHLNTDNQTMLKIIDMMLSSGIQLSSIERVKGMVEYGKV